MPIKYNENPIIQEIRNQAKSQEIEVLTNLCIEQLLKNPVAFISFAICGEMLRSEKYIYDFNINDPENEELILSIKDEFITEFFNNKIISQAINDGQDQLKYLIGFNLGIELYKMVYYLDGANIFILDELHGNIAELIEIRSQN